MNTPNVIILLAVLAIALAMAFHQALKWFLRPASRQEVSRLIRHDKHVQDCRRQARADRLAGKAPHIWVPKMYGPLGVRGFRAADYFAHMRRMGLRARMAAGLANVGEGFHARGLKTYYPADVVPNSTSNPYNSRYLLVKQAPQGTVLGASIAPGWTVNADDICYILGAADISIPLGVMTDDIGNAALNAPPYSSNVQLLGGANEATILLVTDKQVQAGQLLVPSLTAAGNASTVPAVAGVYWCVGMALSTSEGATTLIEADPERFPISVDEIT